MKLIILLDFIKKENSSWLPKLHITKGVFWNSNLKAVYLSPTPLFSSSNKWFTENWSL